MGLVVGSARGGAYLVRVDGAEVSCRLRGRMRVGGGIGLDKVVIGDRVQVTPSPEEPDRGLIEAVVPRESWIARGRLRKPPQIIAANLDQVIIVMSAMMPDLSLHALDRFLAIAWSCQVPPVVVVNKIDLDCEAVIRDAIAEIYEPLGVPLLFTSATTGEGLDALAAALRDQVSAVIGPSGAGKSSLLNQINPDYQLRTGEVMQIGKGRHTTTDSRLLPLDCGGWVADTPGIKTIQLLEAAVARTEVEALFPDVQAHSPGCRFTNCTHREEPGCAVMEAVAAGDLAPSRWESYQRLYEEIEQGHAW